MKGRAGKRNVFIIDDHPIVRQGLTQLINQEPDLGVCGEAENAEAALTLIRKANPDIAIVDISLPDMDGIELTKVIRERFRNLPVLIVSMHDESVFAEKALNAGARGYIMKQEAIEKMMEAIRKVLRRELYVSERVSADIVKKFIDGKTEMTSTPEQLLTDREFEVFGLIGKGLGAPAIAEKLNVNVKTVEAYRSNIKKRLGLKDSAELLKHAIHWAKN